MGANWVKLLGFLENVKLCSILSSRSWAIPPSFSSLPTCYVDANLKIPLSRDSDRVLWEGRDLLNFDIICKSLFGFFKEVYKFKNFWFKGFALNYGVYY